MGLIFNRYDREIQCLFQRTGEDKMFTTLITFFALC